LLAIVVSVFRLSIETLPGLDESTRNALHIVELLVAGAFTVQYALRVLCAEDRLGYMRSFFGIIDLVAILPFCLALGLDLSALRAVRLLRVFRLLKLVRYVDAMQRFQRAFEISREEIVILLLVVAMTLFLSATGIYFFEHEAQPAVFQSIPRSLWWAVTSLTTVGYGDA